MELLVDHAIATAVGDMFPSESPVSHYDLDVAFTRFGLRTADPRIALPDQMHGKGKRVKAVLTHAADTSPNEGGKLVIFLMAQMRGGGAFRADSVCCLQDDVVANARAALKSAGFDLAGDGALGPLVLENLSGRDLTQALATYVERARSGSTDAARPVRARSAPAAARRPVRRTDRGRRIPRSSRCVRRR